MNSRTSRKIDMLVRVRNVSSEHVELFPGSSKSAEIVEFINSVVGQIDSHSARQLLGGSSSRQNVKNKADLRISIKEILSAIKHTAKLLTDEIPNVNEKFQLPKSRADKVLLATAQAFATDLKPYIAIFVEYGLKKDLSEQLMNDITAFSEILKIQDSANSNIIGAVTKIEELVNQGVKAAKKLDNFITNQYKHDLEIMAMWKQAYHIQRPARPAKTPIVKEPVKPVEPAGS